MGKFLRHISKGTESLPQNQIILWHFKLRLFSVTHFIVWNIKWSQHWVAQGLENQSWWHRNTYDKICKYPRCNLWLILVFNFNNSF